MRFPKKDILASLICGEIASLFLLFLIKNPYIKEFKGLAEIMGNWVWLLPLILPLIFLIGVITGFFLSRIIKVVYQLIKFGEVGVLNTFIDLGVLSILMSISGIAKGWPYSLFKGLSFIVAATNSYFWNKLWTFQKKGFIQAKKEYTQFLIVSGVGFVINVTCASLVVNLIGPQFGLSSHLWGIIGGIIAAFAGLTWNFLGYKFLVFKK
jgi:putative flippase GtrA